MFSSSFMHHGVDTASPLLRSTKRLHQHLKNEEEVVVANVDADQHRELAERYGVSGYPTLKFFPKNNKDGEDYEGGRDLDDFVNSFNEKCDTSHDAKGQLTSNAGIIGIIATLDTLVKELVHIEKSLLEMEIMKYQKRNQLAKMMQLMKNLSK